MPPCMSETKNGNPPSGVKLDGKASISLEELKKHNKKGDLWIAIEGKVYDVSNYAKHHPGGEHMMVNLAGQDATDVYHAFHTRHGSGYKAHAILQKGLPHVANLQARTETPIESGFRELREKVDNDGLYETSKLFYFCLTCWLVFLFVSSIYLTLTATGYGSTVVAGCVYALFLQQIAFVGHDTAHNGITHDRFWDMMIGILVGPMASGISTAWWKRSHNCHHVVTNSLTHDPDIQHMPVFAIDEKFWKNKQGGTWSEYHKKFFHFDAVAKFLISYQHYLYFPIMGFARWNLYVQSWMLLLNKEIKTEKRYWEMCAMVFWACYFVALACQLPSAGMTLTFMLVSHFLAGILHVQITISHFAMPTYSGSDFDGKPGENFLRQQLYTSMDLDSTWWNDWFHGGLQWQVAHHIFPRLPRHNLPIVKTMLQDFCKKHGLVYKSVPTPDGVQETIACLKKAAYKARDSNVVNFTESMLWQGMNAEG